MFTTDDQLSPQLSGQNNTLHTLTILTGSFKVRLVPHWPPVQLWAPYLPVHYQIGLDVEMLFSLLVCSGLLELPYRWHVMALEC